MTGRRVLVMAKAPVEGQVKTRLCPPCTLKEAAAVAEAALVDTLRVATACADVVLALAGDAGDWLPEGVEVIAQRGDGFNARLENAWSDFGSGGMQIGMDTPQLTPAQLTGAFELLEESQAVLGPATDGGWWAIGLHRPETGIFDGVMMSRSDTCAQQRQRMHDLGLDPRPLPTLVDLDHWTDAVELASAFPDNQTAAVVQGITS